LEGDPRKIADVIVQLANSDEAPVQAFQFCSETVTLFSLAVNSFVQAFNEPASRDLKGFTDSKQSRNRDRSTGFDLLPMAG